MEFLLDRKNETANKTLESILETEKSKSEYLLHISLDSDKL